MTSSVSVVINFDINNVAQSVTITASGLPSLATITVKLNGSTVGVFSTDSLGTITRTIAASAFLQQLGNILESASWSAISISSGASFRASGTLNGTTTSLDVSVV